MENPYKQSDEGHMLFQRTTDSFKASFYQKANMKLDQRGDRNGAEMFSTADL